MHRTAVRVAIVKGQAELSMLVNEQGIFLRSGSCRGPFIKLLHRPTGLLSIDFQCRKVAVSKIGVCRYDESSLSRRYTLGWSDKERQIFLDSGIHSILLLRP